eukprot:15466902-Alexandrium_andersonii.AAC.1
MCVAAALFERSHALPVQLAGSLDAGALAYVFETVSWGGTEQKLALNLDSTLSNHQQISAWEVCCVKRVVHIGFKNMHFVYECVCPPIPCLGTDAGTLADALLDHPHSRPHVEMFARLASKSLFTGCSRISDAALSNM